MRPVPKQARNGGKTALRPIALRPHPKGRMAKPKKDTLGDRMKRYEAMTRYSLPRRTYTIVRVDGRAFHTFTRGLQRPYDTGFMSVMDTTAIRLCEEIAGAQFAYVQSDEISLLVTDFQSIDTQPWFDGGLQKWASVGASIATAAFNFEIAKLYFASAYGQEAIGDHPPLGKKKPLATFDFRAFPLPDFVEVENYFIWRQNDAVRNSLAMLAQYYATHKQLMGKKRADQHDIIHAAGDNWAKHPNGFKNGRVVRYKTFDEVVRATRGIPAAEKVKALKERTSNWFADSATPVFTQDRKYLRDMVPIAWENDIVVRKP